MAEYTGYVGVVPDEIKLKQPDIWVGVFVQLVIHPVTLLK